MPAPVVATFSVAALVAAHTAFRDLIDAGTAAGAIRIRDAADVLLAQVPLADPCGTVNGITGQLVFNVSGPDPSADANGTAAYAQFLDSDGNVHLSLPVEQGSAPVAGKLVLNTLDIIAGAPVYIVSATLG